MIVELTPMTVFLKIKTAFIPETLLKDAAASY